MAGITLRTARQVVPMIYAYTTPEIARHNGWTKIGYTEQSVDKRLKQQTHTADVLFHEEWRGNAVYDDGSGEVFTDHDFHAYLRKLNVENDRKNEWFHLDGQQSRRYFQDFRMNRGRVQLRLLQAGRCTDGAYRYQSPCHRQQLVQRLCALSGQGVRLSVCQPCGCPCRAAPCAGRAGLSGCRRTGRGIV